ncbi:hypothetical protein EMQ25_10165 [Arsenicitalea aurantiaca]|uniref:Type VI secretion system-associated protein TagO n=1 Tax=Arsenicitalea aurantiaca TaxID=1783274 RepID=A0A433XB34_9HYPH|nr:hypothetical protein [Arsenicitalea aurantiaca]RUT31218.1 hypothetical protein EMQ25_10165 [Arsenicitalea aurantiaca]
MTLRSVALAMLASTAFGLPATAQTTELERAAACTAIGEDAERLACYDEIFLGPDGVALTPALSHAEFSLVFESERDIPARPSGRRPATLTIACDAGEVAIAFGFANQLVSATGNTAGITLQYDLQPARSSSLRASPDNTALLITDDQEARTLLDQLSGVTTLLVRTTPFRQRSVAVNFRVAPILEQLPAFLEACT